MSLVNVYETEFVLRSLMAWGKKLVLSLSVFAIMLLKRLPDGSKQKSCFCIYIYIYIYIYIHTHTGAGHIIRISSKSWFISLIPFNK